MTNEIKTEELKTKKKNHVEVTEDLIFFRDSSKKRLLREHIKVTKYINSLKKAMTTKATDVDSADVVIDFIDEIITNTNSIITFDELFSIYSLKTKSSNVIVYDKINIDFFDTLNNNFDVFTECFSFVINEFLPEEANLSEQEIKKN